MLRHLFASILILGSAVVLSAPSANGQSIDLPFSGTINPNCTFNESITPGQLGLIASNTIGTVGPLSGAGFTVSCSAPTNLTISAPIQTAGPTLTPVSCSSSLTAPLGGISPITFNSCNGSSPPSSVQSGSGLVNISVQNASAIPPGAYGYKVTVTITP